MIRINNSKNIKLNKNYLQFEIKTFFFFFVDTTFKMSLTFFNFNIEILRILLKCNVKKTKINQIIILFTFL